MRQFKDGKGREWAVAVTVDSIKRVRGLVEVDLLKAAEGQLLAQLAEDPVKLVDVLYALCKPQADAAGVTDEQFGAAMAGESIDAATVAFMEDLADFFPSAKRGMLRAAIAKVREIQDKAGALATKMVQDQDTTAAVAQAFGGQSTSSPASPG